MKNYQILTSFQNLIPLENYSYQIESTNGNWPVTATPISGSFVPMSESHDINTNIKFCISSGVCTGPNLLPYSTGLCSLDNIPFTEFRVKLNLPYSNQKIYSKPQRVECDDCLKKPKIDDLTINKTNNEITNISGTVSELTEGRRYLYNISSLGGNYPLVMQNTSGFFTAQSDKENLIINTEFCCPSGSCSGVVFSKTYNSLKKTNTLEHSISLMISSDCPDMQTTKTLKISQDKTNPGFITPNNISLTKDSKGCSKFNLSLTNLAKDHSYSYTYKLKDADWPVYFENISGVISNTSGTLDIGTNIAFCPSSGLCAGLTTLGQKKNSKIGSYCSKNKHISFYIEVTPNCYPNSMVFTSDPVTVYCNDCLDSISVNFS